MTVIEACGLRKAFGTTVALDGIDLRVEEGRILGLIGPNGAGKTTALNAVLGLAPYQGELKVLGRDPWRERDMLMRDVCFIADVAVLPRWIRVSQALEYVAGVHPRFDRAKAEGFLAKTTIQRTSKVRELSKGMVAQLHLALVMAIDARLLVLDEPTLGLDILYRKQFYDSLLNDYFDGNRTIVIATHQVDEVQHILTDLVFLERGRVVFDRTLEDCETRYAEVVVHPEQLAAARALRPLSERQVLGRSVLLFEGVDRAAVVGLYVGQSVDAALAPLAHLDPALVVLDQVEQLPHQIQRGLGDLERRAVEQHRPIAGAIDQFARARPGGAEGRPGDADAHAVPLPLEDTRLDGGAEPKCAHAPPFRGGGPQGVGGLQEAFKAGNEAIRIVRFAE